MDLGAVDVLNNQKKSCEKQTNKTNLVLILSKPMKKVLYRNVKSIWSGEIRTRFRVEKVW